MQLSLWKCKEIISVSTNGTQSLVKERIVATGTGQKLLDSWHAHKTTKVNGVEKRGKFVIPLDFSRAGVKVKTVAH